MTTTFGASAYTTAAAAAMPLAKATARPPSNAPTASSNAAHVGVPWVRVYSPPPRKLDASTIGWFNGSPTPDGRPAVTATVAGDIDSLLPHDVPCSDQRRREGPPLIERQRSWRSSVSTWMHTWLAPASRCSCTRLAIVASSPQRNERVDQPITAAVGDVVVGEAEALPVVV